MDTVDTDAAGLAARQDGVIGRGQLRRLGLTDRQIAWRVRAGRLIPCHRHVFLMVGTPPSFRARLRAALMACGPTAVASHRSARSLWGLGPEPDGPIELTISGRNPGRIAGARIYRVRRLLNGAVRTRHGLRCTSPARTVCDLAAVVSRLEVERAVQEAAVRRLITIPELEREVANMNARPGVRVMRAILGHERGGGFTRSYAERRLLSLIDAAGLPRPEKNVRIRGHCVDALWREYRLIVEIDGIASHGTASAFYADRARDAELTASGWRVIRFTALQLRDQPLLVAAQLAQAMGARA